MYRRLLVAVDGSDQSLTAATHAIELAGAVDAKLTMIHVVQFHPVYSHYGLAALPSVEEMDHKYDRGHELLTDLKARAADAAIDCDVVLKRGTPYDEIVKLADDIEPDVIVLGRTRAGWLERLFNISTTARVIKEAACPVLVVQ